MQWILVPQGWVFFILTSFDPICSPLRGGLRQILSSNISPPSGGGGYPERTKKPIDTCDKEDKDGKETEHTRGAKFFTSDARVTRMAKKAKHIFEERRRSIRPNHLRLVVRTTRQGSKMVDGDARTTNMAGTTEQTCG